MTGERERGADHTAYALPLSRRSLSEAGNAASSAVDKRRGAAPGGAAVSPLLAASGPLPVKALAAGGCSLPRGGWRGAGPGSSCKPEPREDDAAAPLPRTPLPRTGGVHEYGALGLSKVPKPLPGSCSGSGGASGADGAPTAKPLVLSVR